MTPTPEQGITDAQLLQLGRAAWATEKRARTENDYISISEVPIALGLTAHGPDVVEKARRWCAVEWASRFAGA